MPTPGQLQSGASLLAGILVGWIIAFGWSHRTSSPVPDSVPPAGDAVRARIALVEPQAPRAPGQDSGPWGDLEVRSVWLEPPVEDIPSSTCDTRPPAWYVRGQTRASLPALLTALGVPKDLGPALAGVAEFYDEGVVISPPAEVVIALPSDVRARLYTLLEPERMNGFIRFGFRAGARDFEERLATAGLSPATVSLFQRLAYRDGPMVRVADIALLCARAASDTDRLRIVMTLARTRSLIASLVLQRGADVAALGRYWTVGAGPSEAASMLEAVGRVGGKVDIEHLLPPLGRDRLNRFPDGTGTALECFWTSLNFAALEPDDSLALPGVGGPVLDARYAAVADIRYDMTRDIGQAEALRGLRFGDLLALEDDTNLISHLVVHIAGDIVFTKNGTGVWNPWVLTRFQDVVETYPRTTHAQVLRLRE